MSLGPLYISFIHQTKPAPRKFKLVNIHNLKDYQKAVNPKLKTRTDSGHVNGKNECTYSFDYEMKLDEVWYQQQRHILALISLLAMHMLQAFQIHYSRHEWKIDSWRKGYSGFKTYKQPKVEKSQEPNTNFQLQYLEQKIVACIYHQRSTNSVFFRAQLWVLISKSVSN